MRLQLDSVLNCTLRPRLPQDREQQRAGAAAAEHRGAAEPGLLVSVHGFSTTKGVARAVCCVQQDAVKWSTEHMTKRLLRALPWPPGRCMEADGHLPRRSEGGWMLCHPL